MQSHEVTDVEYQTQVGVITKGMQRLREGSKHRGSISEDTGLRAPERERSRARPGRKTRPRHPQKTEESPSASPLPTQNWDYLLPSGPGWV